MQQESVCIPLSHSILQVFDTLRNERPGVFKKVVPVPGDLEHPGLGLSEGDLQLLVNNVSVIFHMAATIRFNASLRYVSPRLYNYKYLRC